MIAIQGRLWNNRGNGSSRPSGKAASTAAAASFTTFVPLLSICISKRLSNSISDGFDPVNTEADGAGSANAFQVLNEQLHFIAVIAITQEQGADAAKCFGHSEYIGAGFSDVQEDLTR